MYDIERKIAEILRIIGESSKPVGARVVARGLEKSGYSIGERAVRYHLKALDRRGLTKNRGYLGRTLTQKGREELENALVYDRVGFIISKIETLAYATSFDPKKAEGSIVVNLSYIDRNKFDKALEIVKEVFSAGFTVSPYVRIFEEGEEFEGIVIPRGKVGLATTCSVTIDGVLLKAGIQTEPRYGGVVQVKNQKALRFTDMISYEGSTLDPLEVFMARGMTSINEAVKTGSGKILVNFREVPAIAKRKAEEILKKLRSAGFSGVLDIGEINRPLLAVPVGKNRFGIAIVGGVNALAAVEEKGIKTETKAISASMDIKYMKRL